MTQRGDPLHNVLAERMSNTIKNDWLLDRDDESFEQVSKRTEDAVYVYDHVWSHQGTNMRTPMGVVSETGGLTAQYSLIGTDGLAPCRQGDPQPKSFWLLVTLHFPEEGLRR